MYHKVSTYYEMFLGFFRIPKPIVHWVIAGHVGPAAVTTKQAVTAKQIVTAKQAVTCSLYKCSGNICRPSVST